MTSSVVLSFDHSCTRWAKVWPVVAVLALSACASNVKLNDANSSGSSSGGTVAVPATNGNADATRSESAVAAVAAPAVAKAPSFAELPKTIYFDYDSYVIKPEFNPVVEGYAKALQAAGSQRLMLEGHTDERGGREYNLALGQKRAEAVLRSLTVLGASAEQLEATSMGEEKPAVEGHDESAWSKNRRTEFKVR